MSECKFCNARDNNQGRKNADLPIFDRRINAGFLGEIRMTGTILYIDNEDILYLNMHFEHGQNIADKKYIKYCPICGRKLEKVKPKEAVGGKNETY